MQPFETIFCLIATIFVLTLLLNRLRAYVEPSHLLVIGLAVGATGLVFEGYRWQMIPAYVAFGLTGLALRKQSSTRLAVRILGAAPVFLLLFITVFLGSQMPIVTLPEPSGPYAVGGFDYALVDHSRAERYNPEENRVIPVKVWYPVEKRDVRDHPVEPLWLGMHRGDLDPVSFILGYLRHINTHTHIEAPIADDKVHPVLVFNPSGAVFSVEQNTLLMEHLASHGYVILGVAHPYENRTSIPGAGRIRPSREIPADVRLDSRASVSVSDILLGNNLDLWRPLWETRDRELFATFQRRLSSFVAADRSHDRQAIIADVVASGELDNLGAPITADALLNLFIAHTHLTLANETWVTDTRFVLDHLPNVEAPVDGFYQQLDDNGFGVFGMSLGGSTAAAFCKVDSRCIAGVNLDGTEFHRNWDLPVRSPFLKFHHDGSPDNDFSLLPPANDFFHLTIRGTEHLDFTDVPSFLPLAKTLGMRGTIEGERMGEIVNTVVLNFFTHYMKGGAGPFRVPDFPEVAVRTIPRDPVD